MNDGKASDCIASAPASFAYPNSFVEGLLRGAVEAAIALNEVGSLSDGLRKAIECLGKNSKVDRVFLFEYTDGGNYLTMRAEFALPPCLTLVQSNPAWARISTERLHGTLETHRSRRVSTNIRDKWSRVNDAIHRTVDSIWGTVAPIFVRDNLWGCIGIDLVREQRCFTDTEMEALRSVSAMIGAIVSKVEADDERIRMLAYRSRLLEAVTKATGVLAREQDLRTAIQVAGCVMAEVSGADRFNLFRYEPTTHSVVLESNRASDKAASLGYGPYPCEDFREVFDVLLSGEVYTSCTEHKTGLNRELNERTGTKSDLMVPIFVDGMFWGLLNWDDCTHERKWSVGEIEVLKIAADAVAGAIARDKLQAQRNEALAQQREAAAMAASAEAMRLNRHLMATLDAGRALMEAKDFEAGLLIWVGRLAESVSADRAGIGRFQEVDGQLLPMNQIDWARTGLNTLAGVVVPQTDDFVEWGKRLSMGEYIWAKFDDLKDPRSRNFWRQTDCACNIVVPVSLAGQLWGFLYFDFREVRPFDPVLPTVLCTAAENVAAALARERFQRQLSWERERAARAPFEHMAKANEAMRHALASLSRNAELDEFLEAMLRESLRTAGAHSGAIAIVHERDGMLLLDHPILIARGEVMPYEEKIRRNLTHLPFNEPLRKYWIAIQESDDLSANEPSSDVNIGGFKEFHREFENHHVRCLAMRTAGQAIGWLGLGFREKACIGLEQLSLLRLLADQMTMAIEMRRLADEARDTAVAIERQRHAELRMEELSRANTALRWSVERVMENRRFESLGCSFLEAFARATNAAAGAIVLRSVSSPLEYAVDVVLDRDRFLTPDEMRAEPHLRRLIDTERDELTILRSALEKGDAVTLSVSAFRSQFPEAFSFHSARSHKQLWTVPLLFRRELVGAVVLAFTDERTTEGPLLETVRALSQQFVLALELSRLAAENSNTAVIEERTRIARELHDSLMHSITGILMSAQAGTAAHRLGNAEAAVLCLERVEELARRSLRTARQSVTTLETSIDYSDVLGRLTELVRGFDRSGIKFNLEIDGVSSVPAEIGLHLVRIAEEAIGNALRYAQASEIRLRVLGLPRIIEMVIEDNGIGFEPSNSPTDVGTGIVGMRRRAERIGGELTIKTAKQIGTTIRVKVPIN
ncbi:MAG: GAF domain-containing sensor histidine kinase [Opitutaceae bacterium]|nr:GAF domain-containing sensor histidine kinase [Opitutaceae bacterium]